MHLQQGGGGNGAQRRDADARAASRDRALQARADRHAHRSCATCSTICARKSTRWAACLAFINIALVPILVAVFALVLASCAAAAARALGRDA